MKRILWIEDDSEILKNLFSFATKENFEITTIGTYNDYLNLSDHEFSTYNISVIDLMIPSGEKMLSNENETILGMSIIEHIRLKRLSNMPIIVLSGMLRAIESRHRDLLKLSPISVLPKPILPSELRDEILRLL